MRLYIYHAYRKLWLFPLIGAFYLLLIFIQGHDSFGFYHQVTEEYPSLLIALLAAFVLTSDTENEFAKCYGISFVKLGITHWLPHFIFPLILAVSVCPIYWLLYTTGRMHEYSLPQPQYGLLIFSLFVTFFLVTSFTLFIRILLRNMYVTLGGFLIAFTPFHTLHDNLLQKRISISMAKYDVWITGLLYNEKYDVTPEMWLTNRLVFLGVAVLFFIGSLVLLKQKNYENIR